MFKSPGKVTPSISTTIFYRSLLTIYLQDQIDRLAKKWNRITFHPDDNHGNIPAKINNLRLALAAVQNATTIDRMFDIVLKVANEHTVTTGMKGAVNFFRRPQSRIEFDKLFNNKREITALGLKKINAHAMKSEIRKPYGYDY